MKYAISLLYLSELITFISGILYWKKLKGTIFRWLPLYFGFIVFSETFGLILRVTGMLRLNLGYFNYFEIPIEFLFFFLLFHRAESGGKFRTLPFVCAIIYLASWAFDMLYLSKHQFFFYSISYSIGNLLLLVTILDYLVRLATSDSILGFRHNMLFWISTGLLIYYLGTFPYYGLRNTMIQNYPQLYQTYSYFMYVFNSLMYLMFTISFVWGRPNSKSS